MATLAVAQLLNGRPAHAACDPMNPDKQCLDPITVDGDPVPATPPLTSQWMTRKGTGMCAAFRSASTATAAGFPTQPPTFPANKEAFPDAMNAFMDGTGSIGDGVRADQTLRTPFDLTNNVQVVGGSPDGDYVDTRGCPTHAGCPFPAENGNLSGDFVTRFRGFFYVQPNWVGQPMHFGFFADDTVAVTIYARNPDPQKPPKSWIVVSQASKPGATKFRVTNQVIFNKSGLYPIEIVHAQYSAEAILEFGILFSTSFTDLEQVNNVSQPKLSGLGFDLLYTIPDYFYQTSWGRPPYLHTPQNPPLPDYDLDRCLQCPRQNADWGQDPVPGKPDGCESDHFCNEAAVCAPCLVNRHCGAQCKICAQPSPVCVPDPNDPDNPMLAHCDECMVDNDCPPGQKCTANNKCKYPPCCPSTPHPLMPDSANPQVRLCSPCAVDADCTDPMYPHCDIQNARCIDTVPENNTDDKCGTMGVNCKNVDGNRPYCLNGQVCVECKADAHCSAGKYCESGTCKACTQDRHCGARCSSCGTSLVAAPDGSVTTLVTDTPFCYSPDGSVDKASCVRCITNSDCGDNGVCNTDDHTCSNTCDPKCTGNQRCHGGKCVECVTSSQCLCGACDETGSCTESCHNNTDCAGNQCCTLAPDGIRKCLPGRCSGAAGGALCGCNLTAGVSPAVVDNNTLDPNGGEAMRSRGTLAAAMAMLLFALMMRRRIVAGGGQR